MNEVETASKVVKTNRHYRQGLFALAIVFLAFFLFVAYVLLQNDKHAQGRTDQILAEAKRLSDDGRIRTQENYRYITCLLVHPIGTRTEELQRECFRQSDLPGGLTLEEFQAVSIPKEILTGISSQATGVPSQGESSGSSSSSSNITPNEPSSQPNTSQSHPATIPPRRTPIPPEHNRPQIGPRNPSIFEKWLQNLLRRNRG